MRLPSECVPVTVTTMPYEVIPGIQSPLILGCIELDCRQLKHLETEHFHITYQNDSAKLRILLRRLFNAGIPDLQYLIASFLHVGEVILVTE